MLIKLNFATMLAYRANFYSSFGANLAWSLFIITSMLLLTSKAPNVFGWTRDELLLLAGMYNVFISVFFILFSHNFNEFSENIHYGKLDAVLMKPIDSQFIMTCLLIGYGSAIRLIVGLLFVSYMLSQMHITLSFLTIGGFIVLFILSLIILYSFWFFVMTLTLWFTNLENLVNLLYEINHITRFPPEMYKGASIFLFITLFPLTLVIISPAKVLLQKILLGDIIWPIICSMMLFVVSRQFWKFALRYYTSASS